MSEAAGEAKTWCARMVDSTLARYTPEDFIWNYDHGLLVMAIQRAGDVLQDPRYHAFVAGWIDHFVRADGTIRRYRKESYNIDLVNPGRLFFAAYERTGEERYRNAIEILRDQMRTHPRNNAGGFWHKQIYPHQMWLDGIYMAGPFMAEYALRFDEPATFDDVVHQVELIERHTRDPESGLLYHAWDESRQQRWCDPKTGCSRYFWGRAVGWFMMALVDILDYLPQSHPGRPALIAMLEKTAAAVAGMQDRSTGLWYQILDMAQRDGNYLEASASTMFVYALAKGVRNGCLAHGYLDVARRGFAGVVENLLETDAEGRLTLTRVCGGAGLGGEPYRDGSFEYYTTEKVIANDPKGVGPFILAALEMDLAGVTA